MLVVISVIGVRHLLEPPLAPLTAIAGAGLAFLFLVFALDDAPTWLTHLTTSSRATLHIAPLLVVFGILTWNQLAAPVPHADRRHDGCRHLLTLRGERPA